MATETAQNVAQKVQGISPSAAGGSAPTVTGTGTGLGSEARGILDREIAIASRKGDPLGLQLSEYQRQINLGEAQKGIQGLSMAKKLGDIRNRIAQQKLDQREEQARSGFIGTGAKARSQVGLDRQIGTTLEGAESEYLNNLRNLNVQIGSARQAELGIAQPLIAKGIARKVAATGQGMYDMKSDQGFFGRFAGNFGKDQTTSARLNKEAFAGNETMQNLVNQFGIDINSSDFQNQVYDALKQTLTTEAGSVYDREIDIKFDAGGGLKTVSTQTKSLAKTIFDDIMGGVTIAALAAIPLTGGTSLLGSSAAGAGEAAALGVAEAGAETVGTIAGAEAAAEAASLGAAGAAEAIGASTANFINEAIAAGGAEAASITMGEVAAEVGASTTTEAMSATMGDSIMGGLAGLGEEGLTAETAELTSEAIAQNFATSLAETFSEAELAEVSGSTMTTATNMARESFTEAVANGASVEQAQEIAFTNASNIISNNNLMTSVAETMGSTTSTSAGVAGTQATQTGVRGALQRVGQSSVGRGVKALGRGANFPLKATFKGTGMALRNKIARRFGLSLAAATEIGRRVEDLNDMGLSDETMNKIVEEMAQNYK